jgi:eukaryotic translation initiation factor 2C
MSVLALVAKLMAESSRGSYSKEENEAWYLSILQKASDTFPWELQKVLPMLNSEIGLRDLRVSVDYFGYERKNRVLGISSRPANQQKFQCDGRERNVAEYFEERWGKKLKCPGLPCLELTKKGNFVPLELISICGGEHNILVGKLRGDYQADVVRRTAMDPSIRLKGIRKVLNDDSVGLRRALKDKGIDVDVNMLKVTGRVLEKPVLVGKADGKCEIGRYANSVKAKTPPDFQVPWALWSFTPDSEPGLREFATSFLRVASDRGLWFTEPQSVGWPRKAFSSWREDDLRQDLNQLHEEFPTLRMLVILLPDDSQETKALYGHLKSISENEIRSFGTQCIQCKPKGGKNQMTGLQAGQQKLNNVMLKICSKLPEKMTSNVPQGAAHNVCLREPHPLLQAEAGTVVIGADVTHNVVGVSVAGVVASRDTSFMTYFSEVRAQRPFDLEGSKTRRRKSEERILDLKDMIQKLLRRWQAANNCLPKVILYYRDGVSDGQFQQVLKMEMNQLVQAFHEFKGGKYSPQLAIIVGQKRHQTRFFRDVPGEEQVGKGKDAAKKGNSSKGGKGDGAHGKGGKSGKGGKGDDVQVEPGTVVGEGIAQPGHLNFFLVAHQGIKGTSVPCHYHVLHLDARLLKKISIDDIESITFQLSHLYSRADKAVSYAAPTYLADHLCERGKLYLETKFAGSYDQWSLSGDSEEQLRQQIHERVEWFNVELQKGHEGQQAGHLQGLNYFC